MDKDEIIKKQQATIKDLNQKLVNSAESFIHVVTRLKAELRMIKEVN